MKRYYVYAYVDKTEQPFYVGKGCGGRYRDISSRKHNRHLYNKIQKLRKTQCIKDFTKFIATDLTEQQALELEIELINQYGRRDLGTGILLNATEGGDGVFSGKPRSSKAMCKKEEIIKLYVEDKLTLKQVAEEVQETVTVVLRVLNLCNIKRRSSGVKKPVLPSNIAEEFKTTPLATVYAFAVKYKCDRCSIERVLREAGIDIFDGRRYGKKKLQATDVAECTRVCK